MNQETLPNVVLVDGGRIPFQRAGTLYRNRTAYDLARRAVASLLMRHPGLADRIEQVDLGTVIQDVDTSNLAREAALGSGLPASVPARTHTMACVSANAAVAAVHDAIRLGNIRLGLAAGAETMSDVPIRLSRPMRQALLRARSAKGAGGLLKAFKGWKPSHLAPAIPAITEFSSGESMGQSADRMARRYGVGRDEQDRFAVRSHQLAHAAREIGHTSFGGEWLDAADAPDFASVDRENGIRPDTGVEQLGRLRPVFERKDGTITAGNASFLTDGASAALLAEESMARENGLPVLARIKGFRFDARDPREDLLMGPALSIPRLLRDLGLTMGDIDVIELHEAFAAQVLCLLRALDSKDYFREHHPGMAPTGAPDPDRVNAWGGSLAVGHPFGATGIRIMCTAARRLHAEDGKLALIASCAAGGQSHAMVLERI